MERLSQISHNHHHNRNRIHNCNHNGRNDADVEMAVAPFPQQQPVTGNLLESPIGTITAVMTFGLASCATCDLELGITLLSCCAMSSLVCPAGTSTIIIIWHTAAPVASNKTVAS